MVHIVKMRGDQAIRYVADNLPKWASGETPTTKDDLMTAHGIVAVALRQMMALELQLRLRMVAQGFDSEGVVETVRAIPPDEYAREIK